MVVLIVEVMLKLLTLRLPLSVHGADYTKAAKSHVFAPMYASYRFKCSCLAKNILRINGSIGLIINCFLCTKMHGNYEDLPNVNQRSTSSLSIPTIPNPDEVLCFNSVFFLKEAA